MKKRTLFFQITIFACAALAALFTYQGCVTDTYEIKLTSIALTPVGSNVPTGATKQFTAEGAYNDASTENLTATVAWSSSDTAVATIDATGLATPIAAGVTTITATSGSVSGSTTLTVTNAVLTSITVSPTSPSIAKGTTVQLTATGHYADNSTQDLTTQVAWTSSDLSVTLSASGLATTTVAGSGITITATKSTFSGTTTLTVKDVTLTSLTVTPATSEVPAGGIQQYTATGTFSDNSTQDLTGQITWSTSNSSVAVFEGLVPGKVKTAQEGVVTVTATSGGNLGIISGNAALTVTKARISC